MIVEPARVNASRGRRAWGIASDLLIATALIWALPLLLGAAHFAVASLWGSR